MVSFLRILLWIGLCLSTRCLLAGDAANQLEFNRDIRPILSEHCYRCHGPDAAQRQADLRFDIPITASVIHEGGAAIVPRHPEKSELVRRITTTDVDARMPPFDSGVPLDDGQVRQLRTWIAQGANYEGHWAYRRPQRPRVPMDGTHPVTRHPIDAFVRRKLKTRGMSTSPRANRRALIRRVSLDLIGLPPSVGDVRRFLSDDRVDAYERLIDRLMASPHYGERMAQNWLDQARYADTTGFAADKPRTMWLYRDWVIDALNANVPFDRFTIEQLAGDMLSNATTAQRIATGFHRNSMQALGNNPRKEEFRVKGIVDRLDTTGRVWLGTTLACAECHDHKYDPWTQREYYELFAIFNNIPHLGEKFEIHGPRLSVTRGNYGPVQAQVMREREEPRETFVHVRGNFETRGDRVQPGIPAFLRSSNGVLPQDRLAFARWLVDGQNPLVARVIVNRIWQHFFGNGIVRTTEDFGSQGEWPSHPELLDWLAVEFVACDWDLRHIHKLILTSATYQQTSSAGVERFRQDPENRWLSRGPRQRLAAEQIRDMAMFTSGLLSTRVGGPSVYPGQPSHVGEFRDNTAGEWTTSHNGDRYRRGLYTFWQRMYPYPSLQIFDAPSRERCVVRRERSNTPLQALVLLNDPAFVEAAQAFGQRIWRSGDDDEKRIEFAFEAALSRLPDHDEQQQFLAFATNQRAKAAANIEISTPELAVWTLVASTLLNLDEAISKQ